ncbi:MAG: LLM class F420-dependent oxidoreductase [Actinomycetota bacterium]
MTLKLGLELPYTEMHERDAMLALARDAEALGYDAIWVSELYSFDAFTTLTHLAVGTDRIKLGTNIANIYARTPAMLASTAASLDQISGGRFILGIGVSGPQVIEGWHGVPYDKPLARTRETIEIVRQIVAGDRLVHEGHVFNVTKGLKLINKPFRPDLPIYVASLGPKNVELTAELADGWLPTFFSPAHAKDVFGPALDAGRAKRSPALGPLEIAPMVPALAGDVSVAREVMRWGVGFYVGGMGSREKNFYNALVRRYGYVEEAERIQDLFLSGDKQAAIAAVPDELVDAVCLAGDDARLRDGLAAFEDAGVTAIVVGPMAPDAESRRATLEAIARANS